MKKDEFEEKFEEKFEELLKETLAANPQLVQAWNDMPWLQKSATENPNIDAEMAEHGEWLLRIFVDACDQRPR